MKKIILTLAAVLAAQVTEAKLSEMKFDPFVPVGAVRDGYVDPNDLMKIHRQYGINRFLLCGTPGLSVRLVGFPGLDVYEKEARRIVELKKFFAGTPVRIGWWCAPFLKQGLNAPYQHIVGIDGRVSPISICPLDSEFRKAMAARFAAVAAAHPEAILIEDDYSLQNHSNAPFGCFCPLHLESFAKLAGKRYSREELAEIFREDKRETQKLRCLFAENAKQSLILMAKDLRAAVDKVAPEVRIGVAETNNTDADGFISIDVPRALAGPNTRPLIRVRTAWYTSTDSPQYMPDYLAHSMYTGERLPEDFEYMQEGDTYPHTTYFQSPALLRTFTDINLAYGSDNMLLYGGQYLDDPAEDPAFFEMYRRNAARFEALRQAADGGSLDGVRILYEPLCQSVKNLTRAGRLTLVHTAAMFARMGIPYSTKYGDPAILVGQIADFLSDEELRKILSGGVLIDAEAAEILCKRGFGDLIGVSIKPVEKYGFVGERICSDPLFDGIRGRYIYNLAFAPAGSEHSVQYKNPVPLEGAQALTYFFDPFGKDMQPGMVRFTNRLGGRVVVLACTVCFNRTASLFCLRKQEMLRLLLGWLGGKALPAAVYRTPNVWLLLRHTKAGTLFFLTNLSTGEREDVPLQLAPEYRDAEVEEIQIDGTWKRVELRRGADGTSVVPGKLLPVTTRVFRFRNNK